MNRRNGALNGILVTHSMTEMITQLHIGNELQHVNNLSTQISDILVFIRILSVAILNMIFALIESLP
jgi:hypothetical protein